MFGAQRMVAPNFERLWEALEDLFAVVICRRGLAVHQASGSHDDSAEVMHETLMAKTNAEHGHTIGKCGNHVERHSSIFRAPRAR